MKASQTLVVLAAALGSASAHWNATTTDINTVIVTAPCTTSTLIGTGTGGFTATGNGSHTYTKPTLSTSTTVTGTTTGPSSVVTAGAASLDARVFVGAVAAVAAIAFSL